ncbi:pentapeptide repeat-containing protein [Novosphingobium humi]|uniref:Pentapeptide repeat-containing protein n=1 Tax=Novosphingobium humi TaxID=2282397 RepID=A0ABY7U0S2_9SPHN|nr:pentapeptide repeat-containing protein [Novosphingobium humi]WCT78891.1 pentapeptide repeat-containing protein [Novosphingobium humi]
MSDEMAESETHLSISLPVDFGIEADWKELLIGATTAVSEYFVKGHPDGLSSGINALIKFSTSFKAKPSPGYLCWALTITATAWSLDQSEIFNESEKQEIVDVFGKIIRSSKEEIDQTDIEVPLEFFDRPSILPLYKKISLEVISAINENGNYEIDSIRHKINSSFTLAIFSILTARPDYYKPLISALEVPLSSAASLQRSWGLYRSKLIYDFQVKPIFGQEDDKISLQQLYVPLRGAWNEEGLSFEHARPYHVNEPYNVVMIDEELDQWVKSQNVNDWLRLIGGGPGSGKSTTLKSLASRMAMFDGIRPLFVPLQNIGIAGDLRDSVNKYFTEGSDSPFNQPPLSRSSIEDGAPLLLIFDGLDELAAPGEAAKDVVGTFAARLNSLVPALIGTSNRKIRVVVSGRMPAFQSAKRYLPVEPSAALETCGFLPLSHDDKLASKDQRIQWWTQYATVKGEALEVPEAFSNDRLEGITNEPLLCYLLALSGFANQQWELAADNRNRIYHSLMESIYQRGWGDGAIKRLGPGRTLSKNNFIKLMETIALAAWLGGDTRVASEEKFEEAIRITDAEEAWSSFTNDNGQDVTNLAMNFYLKSNDRNQRGFEFTHKSFGEYLASRALLSVATEVSENVSRRMENAMRDWIGATRTGKPSEEMLTFLRDEMRLCLSQTGDTGIAIARKIKAAFQIMISKVSRDGFPVIPSSETWRNLEMEQGNAECALWMVSNSCVSALNEGKEDKEFLILDWSDEGDLSRIISRLLQLADCDIILKCLSYLDASGQLLQGFRGNSSDFSYSLLKKSIFSGVILGESSFFGADLSECRFYQCRLGYVDFSNAHLDSLKIHVTTLNMVTFKEATGLPIYVSPMTFMSAIGMDDNFHEQICIMESQEDEVKRIHSLISRNAEYILESRCVTHSEFAGDYPFVDP